MPILSGPLGFPRVVQRRPSAQFPIGVIGIDENGGVKNIDMGLGGHGQVSFRAGNLVRLRRTQSQLCGHDH